MKEVIAIVRPDKWQATRECADLLGADEVINRRVLGRGRQRGLRYLRPLSGTTDVGVTYLPKRMGSWLIADDEVQALVAAIINVNQSHSYGDGKIFVCPVDQISGVSDA